MLQLFKELNIEDRLQWKSTMIFNQFEEPGTYSRFDFPICPHRRMVWRRFCNNDMLTWPEKTVSAWALFPPCSAVGVCRGVRQVLLDRVAADPQHPRARQR